MQRAIELAKLGAGNVAPNPMVGCVIVHNDTIIGEGWHQKFGEAHAEINALNNVKNKDLLSQSTVYVTLEPCSHYGKTPPCANALINHGIKKVIVGITDPNPLVSGSGIKLLRQSGIEVVTDILANECAELNKRFITYITQNRPYIILKWAQSYDGFIAPDRQTLTADEFEENRHITGLITQKITHLWRTYEAGIMVGTNTILTDNPKLNARAWHGPSPIRITIDLNNRLPKTLHIFDESQKTIIFNYTENINTSTSIITYLPIDKDFDLAPQILNELYKQNIQSVIIEGGTQLLETFINSNNWDEAQVLTSPKQLINGVKAPAISGNITHKFASNLNSISILKPL